jgi:hypothetical protein
MRTKACLLLIVGVSAVCVSAQSPWDSLFTQWGDSTVSWDSLFSRWGDSGTSWDSLVSQWGSDTGSGISDSLLTDLLSQYRDTLQAQDSLAAQDSVILDRLTEVIDSMAAGSSNLPYRPGHGSRFRPGMSTPSGVMTIYDVAGRAVCNLLVGEDESITAALGRQAPLGAGRYVARPAGLAEPAGVIFVR